jgi:hypothetical protein
MTPSSRRRRRRSSPTDRQLRRSADGRTFGSLLGGTVGVAIDGCRSSHPSCCSRRRAKLTALPATAVVARPWRPTVERWAGLGWADTDSERGRSVSGVEARPPTASNERMLRSGLPHGARATVPRRWQFHRLAQRVDATRGRFGRPAMSSARRCCSAADQNPSPCHPPRAILGVVPTRQLGSTVGNVHVPSRISGCGW